MSELDITEASAYLAALGDGEHPKSSTGYLRAALDALEQARAENKDLRQQNLANDHDRVAFLEASLEQCREWHATSEHEREAAEREAGELREVNEELDAMIRSGESRLVAAQERNETLIAVLREIAWIAEGHHADQDTALLLHSLTVDIPSRVGAALSTGEDAE